LKLENKVVWHVVEHPHLIQTISEVEGLVAATNDGTSSRFAENATQKDTRLASVALLRNIIFRLRGKTVGHEEET